MKAAGSSVKVDPPRDVLAAQGSTGANLAPLPSHSAFSEHAISTQDWNLLFDAITCRLLNCFDACLSRGVPGVKALNDEPHGVLNGVQISVFECVEALDQLQVLLTLERMRHQMADLQGQTSST